MSFSFHFFFLYIDDDPGGFLMSLWDYMSDFPLVIQIAIVFIFVALVATIITYLSILFKRYSGYLDDRRAARIIPYIDELLTKHVILNEGIIMDLPVNKIELPLHDFLTPMFKKEKVRLLLINRIVSYRKGFKGSISQLLARLYIELGLDKDAIRKMKSSKWDVKVAAMMELTNMDMAIADANILPLTNSKNKEVRAEARNAYIKLSKNEPFKFFDIATEPLLKWDQVELFKIITTTPDITIPNFARWVTYSNNKSVVSFCLILIAHYNQQDAIPAVMKLLDTNDHQLRANAINCLGKLKSDLAEDKLMSMYNNQPLVCRIETLKAIGRIGSGKYLDVLRHEFLNSTDFDIQKNAAKSIINMKFLAKELIQELLETGSYENKVILKHCMNPLIKY
ncbi:HEAT repeat domain-containing protein [Chitinophagaceae bacterium LWZ2-11]